MSEDNPICWEPKTVYEDAEYLIARVPALFMNGFNVYLKDTEAGIATKIHDAMSFFPTFESAKAFLDSHRAGDPAEANIVRVRVSEPVTVEAVVEPGSIEDLRSRCGDRPKSVTDKASGGE